MSGARLDLDGVGKSFRGLRAVHDVSFAVPAGAIHALIGPNGAGKTTIFNMIAGVYAPDAGAVRLDGRAISGLRPDRVCDAGVGRTFQIVKPFKGLSVLENVIVGALHRRPRVSDAQAMGEEILKRLGLHDRRHHLAESLTLPDRKRLELAGVSLEVAAGEIVTIVGANGAGKSSLIRAIHGIEKPARGSVRFDGVDVTGWSSYRTCEVGIGHVAEGRQVFPNLTVLENLEM